MSLVFVSFLAGALTVLAPCILPVLPIIIGGAVGGARRRNPYIITGSLALAVVAFTLVLKFSTALINVPQYTWGIISGLLIIGFGLISAFPGMWEKVSACLNLQGFTGGELSKAGTKKGVSGDILIGLALGPVFSSCSPTYFVILASVLPTSLTNGIIYLIAYAIGLSLVLLAIALVGQKLVSKISALANPNGLFKRGLGFLFIVVGLFIITGTDKKIQTYLVENGYYDASKIEEKLLTASDMPTLNIYDSSSSSPAVTKNFPRYREIVDPAGFVNSSPFKLENLIGKKVILVDFMTYSCINCIRTFPYLNALYSKYKDEGLEIVGIHTPEFAFEKNYANVVKALKGFEIAFPVVLDNNYSTWRNYQNSYWPRKYLIDIDGYIVYDHIGEGNYDVTEAKIQQLLKERMAKLGENQTISSGLITLSSGVDTPKAGSPETYFGSGRNEYLGNGVKNKSGEQILVMSQSVRLNTLYLSGTWNFTNEYAKNSTPGIIRYNYHAEDVYFVASANSAILVEVTRNGSPLTSETAGVDVVFMDGKSFIEIKENRLYHIIKESGGVGNYILEIKIPSPGLYAYTFTFG